MSAVSVPGAGYKRRELGRCLPLATPFALHVFASHRCNFRCAFCIHSLPAEKMQSLGFKKTIMDFDLFRKCISDLSNFQEPLQVLIFAGWGEPLTHPDIAAMVELAKQCNVAKRIEIVSNGALLNNKLSRDLIDAGLDRIRISVQALDSSKYREIAGVDVHFESIVDNIQYFYTHRNSTRVFIKIVDAAVPQEADRRRFYGIFQGMCDEIAIEQVIPVIEGIDHSVLGDRFEQRHCGGSADPVVVCPFPFYMSVIHPDGRYAPCCSPEPPLPLGNINDTPITEIWKGEALRKFRVAHLEGRRGGVPLCRRCPRPRYDIQEGDNIDMYADTLINIYRANAY